MNDDSNAALTTAGRLFERIQAADVAGVGELYAEDVEVWHNFSNRAQSRAENLATLKGLVESVAEVHYEVVERRALDDERVMQRHNLHCRTRGGEQFLIPACIFITVRNDRIVRIDEYLDTGQANALRAATGRTALG